MELLIGLALKSLIVAAATLGLLRLTAHRSAAERSLIAHLGLVAMVAIPFASLALPALRVPLPDMLTPATPVVSEAALVAFDDITPSTAATAASAPAVDAQPSALSEALASVDWTRVAYAVPAIALLIVTLFALLRLVALRSRAQVLVDPTWLSALAHAQRRMGFKNGTALLTSTDLHSPISWGLMRPVILLNEEALVATHEAEAIIAHELAHVARLDWAKLILSRVATAIFWFNPLAWVLAREAHQLREEAADDAVLAANIAGPDYAQLLVGVARHECRGLLLGAHGVAPSKGSLRRRVGRVLDSTLARGPAGRSWITGFAAGMLVMAAPLAALSFGPKAEDKLSESDIAAAGKTKGVSTTTTTETIDGVKVAELVHPTTPQSQKAWQMVRDPGASSIQQRPDGSMVITSANGAIITLGPPDASGRRAMYMRDHKGSTMSFVDAREVRGMTELMRSRADAAQLRAEANKVRNSSIAERAVEMKLLGVTPEFARDMAAAGFPNLDQEELMEARAIGLNGGWIRAMRAAGVNGSLDDFVELRAVGITPNDVRRNPGADSDELIERKFKIKVPIPPVSVNVHVAEPPEPPEAPDNPE